MAGFPTGPIPADCQGPAGGAPQAWSAVRARSAHRLPRRDSAPAMAARTEVTLPSTSSPTPRTSIPQNGRTVSKTTRKYRGSRGHPSSTCHPGTFWLLVSVESSIACGSDLSCYGRGNDQPMAEPTGLWSILRWKIGWHRLSLSTVQTRMIESTTTGSPQALPLQREPYLTRLVHHRQRGLASRSLQPSDAERAYEPQQYPRGDDRRRKASSPERGPRTEPSRMVTQRRSWSTNASTARRSRSESRSSLSRSRSLAASWDSRLATRSLRSSLSDDP
jgi:hypothetical protein